MLRSYRDAVCWMATRPGAVLVVSDTGARLVDARHHNEGLSMQAARAIFADRRRTGMFTVELSEGRQLLRLGADGVMYHRQLMATRQCACRQKGESHET